MKTVVPTSHTRQLAARMVDAVTEYTTPADVVADLLGQCRAGQEVALVALLLGHATNTHTLTDTGPDTDTGPLDLDVACWAAVDAAADLYNVTPQQVVRGTRRSTDVVARRLAMTVTHLLGGGYSEIGRWFGRDHSTVAKAVDVCLADPLAVRPVTRLADQIREQLHADEGENDVDE